jgi:hypothetical protein
LLAVHNNSSQEDEAEQLLYSSPHFNNYMYYTSINFTLDHPQDTTSANTSHRSSKNDEKQEHHYYNYDAPKKQKHKK